MPQDAPHFRPRSRFYLWSCHHRWACPIGSAKISHTWNIENVLYISHFVKSCSEMHTLNKVTTALMRRYVTATCAILERAPQTELRCWKDGGERRYVSDSHVGNFLLQSFGWISITALRKMQWQCQHGALLIAGQFHLHSQDDEVTTLHKIGLCRY